MADYPRARGSESGGGEFGTGKERKRGVSFDVPGRTRKAFLTDPSSPIEQKKRRGKKREKRKRKKEKGFFTALFGEVKTGGKGTENENSREKKGGKKKKATRETEPNPKEGLPRDPDISSTTQGLKKKGEEPARGRGKKW